MRWSSLIFAAAPESRRQRKISNRDLLKEQDAENSSHNWREGSNGLLEATPLLTVASVADSGNVQWLFTEPLVDWDQSEVAVETLATHCERCPSTLTLA